MRIGPIEAPGFASLSPMAGQTDLPFRVLAKEMGAAFVYTELVSAAGLVRQSAGSRRLIRIHPSEHPVGVQLFGADPEELAAAAELAVDLSGCDLIDLNMGCPVPKVVSLGAGAALMRDPRRVERLVRAVASRVKVPVTAKIRSGWSTLEINAPEVAEAIEAGGGQAVAVHARPRDKRHAGGVDLALLAEVKRAVSIPVIGNGGIRTARDAVGMREATGCDGVLIGRGAVEYPWIFRDCRALEEGRDVEPATASDRLSLIRRHLELHTLHGSTDERETLRAMRVQLLRYAVGVPGAVELRRGLQEITTFAACLAAFERLYGRGVSSLASGSP